MYNCSVEDMQQQCVLLSHLKVTVIYLQNFSREIENVINHRKCRLGVTP